MMTPKLKIKDRLITCGTWLEAHDVYNLKTAALRQHKTTSALLRELAVDFLQREGFEVLTGRPEA